MKNAERWNNEIGDAVERFIKSGGTEAPQRCIHEQMHEDWMQRTGGMGQEPAHMVSCPCRRCNPFYL